MGQRRRKPDVATARLFLPVALTLVALCGSASAAVPESGSAPAVSAKRCKAGFRHAVVGGKHECLRAGRRCERKLDRRYHRYGFHCHGKRLTRTRIEVSPPPPRPPAATVAAVTPIAGAAQVAFGEGSVWVSTPSSVVRVDPGTNAVVATIPLPASGPANWLAVGAGAVWVSVFGDQHTVVRIDPATNVVVASVVVGRNPGRPAPIAVGEGGVWAVNFAESTLVRIDPETNTVAAKIATTPDVRDESRGHPSGVAVTPGAVWIVNHRESATIRVDPATNAVVGTVTGTSDGRAESAHGAVWVGPSIRPDITRIDPATNAVAARIAGCPEGGQLASVAGAVWAAGDGRVCRIDPASNRLADSFSLRTPDGNTFRHSSGMAAGAGALWIASGESSLLRVPVSG